jgi:muramidase (phage lysozyme)
MQVGAPDASTVVAALKSAAQATGSDFHYLLGTAMRESSLKANAQSATSTAAGLFQFVDQTWLGLVKSHGAKYGLGSLASTISQDDGGHFHTANESDRQAILALKKDPQMSALMAGANSMRPISSDPTPPAS